VPDKRNNPSRPADADPKAEHEHEHDGPPEVEDAARQEVEYPEDQTDEG
jgi:hypothetical protein